MFQLNNSLDWRKTAVILGISVVALVGGAVGLGMIVKSPDGGQTSGTGSNEGASQDDTGDPARQQAIEDDKKYAIASLTEIYKHHSVKTETFIDEKTGDGTYSTNIRSCFKVTGLTDKTVEEKINSELKAAYDQAVATEYQNGRNTVNCIEGMNFGGVLSASIYTRTTSYTYTSEKSLFGRLNWRIDTGEQIRFDDIFLKGSGIAEIVEDATYQWQVYELQYAWCGNGMIAESSLGWDRFGYDKIDECMSYAATLVDMERIEQAVNAYQYDSDLEFTISSQQLHFKNNNETVTLPLESVWNRVAIYKRFNKDGLISDGTVVNSFVFSDGYFSADKETDNLVVAQWTQGPNPNFTPMPEPVRKSLLNTLSEIMSEVRKYARQHPDRMVFADSGNHTTCDNSYGDSGTYKCFILTTAMDSVLNEQALQDIAASYRIIRGAVGIGPDTKTYDPTSQWSELKLDVLSKKKLEIAPNGEIVYWGPWN